MASLLKPLKLRITALIASVMLVYTWPPPRLQSAPASASSAERNSFQGKIPEGKVLSSYCKPLFWLPDKDFYDVPMTREVFASLGYNEYMENGTWRKIIQHLKEGKNSLGEINDSLPKNNGEWNVMWWPPLKKNITNLIQNMQPHRKMFYGGHYFRKAEFGKIDVSGVPATFDFPGQAAQFKEYAKQHPEKMWLQKNKHMRGVFLQSVDDFIPTNDAVIAHEYIGNPLLIDGRKFDIAIYTMITSTAPLRAYVYSPDIRLRFCKTDYYPFEPSIRSKYVVSGNHLEIWEMPSLLQLYSQNNCSLDAVNSYLTSTGVDPTLIWSCIYELIGLVLMDKERNLAQGNFFAFARFDFGVCDDLSVFFIEANSRPSLNQPSKPLFNHLIKRVLTDAFHVAGLAADDIELPNCPRKRSYLMKRDICDEEIQIKSEHCVKTCATCNESTVCLICTQCITDDTRKILLKACLEHISRLGMRRVVPPPFPSRMEALNDSYFDLQMGLFRDDGEKLVALWFREKCIQNSTWCS